MNKEPSYSIQESKGSSEPVEHPRGGCEGMLQGVGGRAWEPGEEHPGHTATGLLRTGVPMLDSVVAVGLG